VPALVKPVESVDAAVASVMLADVLRPALVRGILDVVFQEQRRLKGGRVATIPVSRSLIATLRTFLLTPTEEYVFGDPPPAPRSTASLMTRAFRAAGLDGISHHVVRHTGVTDMIEDGISPIAIEEYAGWTSLRMLERYGHLRNAELQRATAGTAARNTAALAEAARQAETQRDAPEAGAHEKVGAQKGHTVAERRVHVARMEDWKCLVVLV
jgi:hypothetical protein